MNFFWFKKMFFVCFSLQNREKKQHRESRESTKKEKKCSFVVHFFLHSALHLSLHTKFFSSFVFTTKIKSTRDGLELYLYK